jgi:Xaa-Pro aminopeptidase
LPPAIPRSDYVRRWRAIQRLMAEKNMDLILTYSNDMATAGAAHARYLTGFPPHFEAVCVLLPLEGEPVLLCGPESEEYARLVGWVKETRVLREFTHPDEDYPYARIQSFGQVVGELRGGSHIDRVGVGGLGMMPRSVSDSFKRALPEAEWIDAEEELCSVRAIKSPAEIAVIRYAYGVAEKGMEAAYAAIKPGATERFVAAEAEYAMRKAGSAGMGIDTIVASGPNTRPILARTTFRKIESDDLVVITLAPRVEGYHGAIGRPVIVGDPEEEVVRAAETAIRAQSECRAAIRGGVPGREVEAIGRRVMGKAGWGGNFLYSGVHSVGVVEFEPPIFGPNSERTLRENMVVSVDIPLFDAPWGGLRVEDGYLVQEDGCEVLSKITFDLFV